MSSKARKRYETLRIAINPPKSLEEAKQRLSEMAESMDSPPSRPKERRIYNYDTPSPQRKKRKRRQA